MTFALPDLAATAALGRRLAPLLRPGDVVALKGDLGAGKTTLVREIVAALSPETDEVPSPTFTLVQTYPTDAADLWHFDLYRLERAEQIYELGLEEAFAGGISLIEWPELIEHLLPRGKTLTVALQLGADGTRSAALSGGSAWTERLSTIRSGDPS